MCLSLKNTCPSTTYLHTTYSQTLIKHLSDCCMTHIHKHTKKPDACLRKQKIKGDDTEPN